jgi:hypothetical protein
MTRHDRLALIASRRYMAGKWVPFQRLRAQRWQARRLSAWRAW